MAFGWNPIASSSSRLMMSWSRRAIAHTSRAID
jgi:hypothetical protein